MFGLSVPLHEVALAVCMTAVTLAILGTMFLIFNRDASRPQGPHQVFTPYPVLPCADAQVLRSWLGSLQPAPSRPATSATPAPTFAAGDGAGRVVPLFSAGQPEHGAIERRHRERRA